MTDPEPKSLEELKAAASAAYYQASDAYNATKSALEAIEDAAKAALEATEDADKAATTLLAAFYDALEAQENSND